MSAPRVPVLDTALCFGGMLQQWLSLGRRVAGLLFPFAYPSPSAPSAPVSYTRAHRYPPHMVAIACLQMASKIHDVDITIWYAALQVNDTEIMEISAMLTESYTVSASCVVWCVRGCVRAVLLHSSAFLRVHLYAFFSSSFISFFFLDWDWLQARDGTTDTLNGCFFFCVLFCGMPDI